VVHLKRPDWDRLFQQVVKLSGDAARRELSVKQYQALPFSKANSESQRNWVDPYDALNLLWVLRPTCRGPPTTTRGMV